MKHWTQAFILIALLSPIGADAAQLKPAPGAQKLCPASLYDDYVEGVWVDENNSAKLLFRMAWDKNGTGCYAWLNKVSDWGIGQTGASNGKVRTSGKRATFSDKWITVKVDRKKGAATFKRNNGPRVTRGALSRK